MTRSDSLTIRNNDFSYNSGLGIGMYRSSGNTIVRNLLDYNVRGYSHGIYQRGQDSSGILLYAQSSNNVVAYNSATHSGDGLFLWAGQITMETGEGGANDNLIFGNDFSFAPANGIEVTFSRNRLIANLLKGSRYGVWGGYSFETEILGNCFAANQFGVAIEHGQDNRIVSNRFDGDTTVISLWANPTQPEGWEYPKHRDTRSRDHVVADNVFAAALTVWRLENSTGHEITGNTTLAEIPSEPCSPRTLLGAAYDSLAPSLPGVLPEIPDAPRAELDRSAIVVDEWGPYDGRSPKLWPVDTSRDTVRLRVLGPEGNWRLTDRRGVEALSAESGRIGDTLTVTPRGDSLSVWAVHLEYVGGPTRSPRGEDRPRGQAVPFSFERFEPLEEWDVRFFAWSDSLADPEQRPDAFESLMAGEPLLSRREDRLDYYWFRPTIDGLPQERWALEAVTSVTLPQGDYSLRTISDDAVRVWIDGRLLIDHWTPHESQVDYARLSSGEHEIRVRYYQLEGWSELRVDVIMGSSRSIGSAGPH
jgi:parallel beta-helix repeat protein